MTPNHQQAADAAEKCDVCHQPLEWPTDGDPSDTWETSKCRHTIRPKVSPPAASPEQVAELPPLERLMPACGVDSTMRVTPHMVDIADGYYCRYDDAMAHIQRERRGPCCREPWCQGECTCKICAPELAIADLEAESQRLRQELAKDDDTQAEMAKRIAELEHWNKCFRSRMFNIRRATGSDHTTACTIWGDDGQGGTAEGFQEPLPCNCGALLNRAKSRLRAVSEALSQENLPRKVPAGQFHKAELVSSPNDVATLLNQLRAIVEGK